MPARESIICGRPRPMTIPSKELCQAEPCRNKCATSVGRLLRGQGDAMHLCLGGPAACCISCRRGCYFSG